MGQHILEKNDFPKKRSNFTNFFEFFLFMNMCVCECENILIIIQKIELINEPNG